MLTRCPDCATAFRVHPEQLKARQGKVRCGQCQRIFNALDSLIEEVVVVPHPPLIDLSEPWATPLAHEAPSSGPGYAATGAPDAVSPAPMTEGMPSGTSGPEPAWPAPDAEVNLVAGAEAVPLPRYSVTPEPINELAVAVAASALPQRTAHDALLADAPAVVAEPAVAVEPMSEQESDADTTPDVDGQAEAMPEPSRLSWLWAGGIVLTIVALLLQGVLHFRVELATLFPQIRPHLLAACELTGCELGLPRKVELLTIEGSDLHPDPAFPGKSGRLGLTVNILNRAPFAQAWPALELTLTDTNDHPLLRRVLNAQEYLIATAPNAQTLAQGINARQDVSIELALDTGDLVASGYRLYLFFP